MHVRGLWTFQWPNEEPDCPTFDASMKGCREGASFRSWEWCEEGDLLAAQACALYLDNHSLDIHEVVTVQNDDRSWYMVTKGRNGVAFDGDREKALWIADKLTARDANYYCPEAVNSPDFAVYDDEKTWTVRLCFEDAYEASRQHDESLASMFDGIGKWIGMGGAATLLIGGLVAHHRLRESKTLRSEASAFADALYDRIVFRLDDPEIRHWFSELAYEVGRVRLADDPEPGVSQDRRTSKLKDVLRDGMKTIASWKHNPWKVYRDNLHWGHARLMPRDHASNSREYVRQLWSGILEAQTDPLPQHFHHAAMAMADGRVQSFLFQMFSPSHSDIEALRERGVVCPTSVVHPERQTSGLDDGPLGTLVTYYINRMLPDFSRGHQPFVKRVTDFDWNRMPSPTQDRLRAAIAENRPGEVRYWIESYVTLPYLLIVALGESKAPTLTNDDAPLSAIEVPDGAPDTPQRVEGDLVGGALDRRRLMPTKAAKVSDGWDYEVPRAEKVEPAPSAPIDTHQPPRTATDRFKDMIEIDGSARVEAFAWPWLAGYDVVRSMVKGGIESPLARGLEGGAAFVAGSVAWRMLNGESLSDIPLSHITRDWAIFSGAHVVTHAATDVVGASALAEGNALVNNLAKKALPMWLGLSVIEYVNTGHVDVKKTAVLGAEITAASAVVDGLVSAVSEVGGVGVVLNGLHQTMWGRIGYGALHFSAVLGVMELGHWGVRNQSRREAMVGFINLGREYDAKAEACEHAIRSRVEERGEAVSDSDVVRCGATMLKSESAWEGARTLMKDVVDAADPDDELGQRANHARRRLIDFDQTIASAMGRPYRPQASLSDIGHIILSD